MTYLTKEFWKGAAERAIKSFAQALLAVLTAGSTGLLDVDWVQGLSVAGLAMLASLLTSAASPDFVAGAPTAEARDDG